MLGLDVYSNSVYGAVFIDSDHTNYKPYIVNGSTTTGAGFIFNSDTSNYVAFIDIYSNGNMRLTFKNTVNTRSGGIATSYSLYGCMSWITAS